MSSWLKRNRTALAAVLVLAPATVAVTFSAEWGSFLETRPTQPVEVEQGVAASFNGTGWRVLDSQRISSGSREGADANLPMGTDLVVVTLEVTPEELDETGDSSSCIAQLGEYASSDTTAVRTWQSDAYSGIDYRTPAGTSSGCDPEIVEPYISTSVFVVPEDAGEDLGLQLQIPDELPRYLLLRF
jgi:hypothetical protein